MAKLIIFFKEKKKVVLYYIISIVIMSSNNIFAQNDVRRKPIDIKLPNDSIITIKAKLGDADAQAFVGRCYYVGEFGVRVNDKQAFYWFNKSAQSGSAYGMYYLGLWFQFNGKTNKGYSYLSKAFRKFSDLAYSGNAKAQYYLGLCYKQSNGVEQDEDKALLWFNESAKNNCTEAMCKLGEIAINPSESFNWYKKAAELNDINGIFNLGLCYYSARGVDVSYEEAAKHFLLASQKGDTGAQFFLARCYEDGVGLNKNLQEAIKWYKKSAETGAAGAYKMGCIYRDGVGVNRNYKLAVKYMKIAAKDEDDEDASDDLKDMLSKGQAYYNKLPQRSKDDLYELKPDDPFASLVLSENWDELTDEMKTIYLKHFKKQKIKEWGSERAYQVAHHLVEIGFTSEQLEYSQGRDYHKNFVYTSNGRVLIMEYSHCIYYLINDSLIALVSRNGIQVGNKKIILSCRDQ